MSAGSMPTGTDLLADVSTLPTVWSRQRPGVRSITDTLIGSLSPFATKTGRSIALTRSSNEWLGMPHAHTKSGTTSRPPKPPGVAPGRPCSTTKEAKVDSGASGRLTVVLVGVGAAYDQIAAGHLSAVPVWRCRLQMLQTAPYAEPVTTAWPTATHCYRALGAARPSGSPLGGDLPQAIGVRSPTGDQVEPGVVAVTGLGAAA
jgi:hypothetical protein